MRSFAVVILFAASAASLPSEAQLSIDITVPGIVQIAPPAPYYEAVPRAMPGRVWVPGRWTWNERDYAWRPGQWQPARPDAVYFPGRWAPAQGGWRWTEDAWRPRAERRQKHRDDDRDEQRHERQNEDGNRGDDHCPPGQAKKGRC